MPYYVRSLTLNGTLNRDALPYETRQAAMDRGCELLPISRDVWIVDHDEKPVANRPAIVEYREARARAVPD